MRGKIRNLKTERGFAFIRGDDAVDYFFHAKASREPFATWRVGDVVMFEIRHTERGLRAANVVRV